jgi:hypothetical protein
MVAVPTKVEAERTSIRSKLAFSETKKGIKYNLSSGRVPTSAVDRAFNAKG